MEREINTLLERYVAILNDKVKTPILAQIRALEYILTDNNRVLEPTHKNLLELVLESCQNQYISLRSITSEMREGKQ